MYLYQTSITDIRVPPPKLGRFEHTFTHQTALQLSHFKRELGRSANTCHLVTCHIPRLLFHTVFLPELNPFPEKPHQAKSCYAFPKHTDTPPAPDLLPRLSRASATIRKKHICKPTIVQKHMLRITGKSTHHDLILFQ